MSWLLKSLASSIGKKCLMALTGLMFCSFVGLHLFGNLSIYGGGGYFSSYAEHLHKLGVLINLAEFVLLGAAILHISMGALLFYEKLRARPERYAVKKRAGGRTWSSATMPYTGLYILFFITIHLITFHFAGATPQTIFDLVARVFSSPAYVIFYIFSMIVIAFHVKHGLWSAFQTLGIINTKYEPLVRGASLVFSIIVGIGFSSIPLWMICLS
jgi:succinate dehydrogenase / fumarate reductase cytochrome b subunit